MSLGLRGDGAGGGVVSRLQGNKPVAMRTTPTTEPIAQHSGARRVPGSAIGTWDRCTRDKGEDPAPGETDTCETSEVGNARPARKR